MSHPKQNRKPAKPRRDVRKRAAALLALLLALLMILPMISVVFQTALAVTQDELQAEINAGKAEANELNSQIDALEDQLAAIQDDKSQAMEQKSLLEQQINAQNEAIRTVESTIAQYDGLIAEKETEVAETQAKEEEQYALFCERVKTMEKVGTVSYWDILFGSSCFSDLLARASMDSEIMKYDNEIMDQLSATRQEFQEQQTALEATRAEQQAEKEDLEARRADLEAKEAEVDQLLAEITANETQIESAKDDLEAAAAEIHAQVAQKQRELQALISSGQVSFDPGSGWQWPVPGYYTITSTFGNRIHPITGRPNNHTGTDIGAPGGTPIQAARGGVVTISTYHYSYGNYVVVQHDNGISTLYAHMRSRAVSEGDVVEQGDVLGYVGTTGSSTGNHLHLEFRINGSRVDALDYYPNLSFTYR